MEAKKMAPKSKCKNAGEKFLNREEEIRKICNKADHSSCSAETPKKQCQLNDKNRKSFKGKEIKPLLSGEKLARRVRFVCDHFRKSNDQKSLREEAEKCGGQKRTTEQVMDIWRQPNLDGIQRAEYLEEERRKCRRSAEKNARMWELAKRNFKKVLDKSNELHVRFKCPQLGEEPCKRRDPCKHTDNRNGENARRFPQLQKRFNGVESKSGKNIASKEINRTGKSNEEAKRKCKAMEKILPNECLCKAAEEETLKKFIPIEAILSKEDEKEMDRIRKCSKKAKIFCKPIEIIQSDDRICETSEDDSDISIRASREAKGLCIPMEAIVSDECIYKVSQDEVDRICRKCKGAKRICTLMNKVLSDECICKAAQEEMDRIRKTSKEAKNICTPMEIIQSDDRICETSEDDSDISIRASGEAKGLCIPMEVIVPDECICKIAQDEMDRIRRASIEAKRICTPMDLVLSNECIYKATAEECADNNEELKKKMEEEKTRKAKEEEDKRKQAEDQKKLEEDEKQKRCEEEKLRKALEKIERRYLHEVEKTRRLMEEQKRHRKIAEEKLRKVEAKERFRKCMLAAEELARKKKREEEESRKKLEEQEKQRLAELKRRLKEQKQIKAKEKAEEKAKNLMEKQQRKKAKNEETQNECEENASKALEAEEKELAKMKWFSKCTDEMDCFKDKLKNQLWQVETEDYCKEEVVDKQARRVEMLRRQREEKAKLNLQLADQLKAHMREVFRNVKEAKYRIAYEERKEEIIMQNRQRVLKRRNCRQKCACKMQKQ